MIWGVSRALGVGLPDLTPDTPAAEVPVLLTGTLALLALANLVAVVGFGNRFRNRGEDLDRWLALGATLMLFTSLQLEFTPLAGTTFVSQGDFLRLLAYIVLVVGVWRAIRVSEFRRAVAEERARVAREIHDGLAQYLFAVTTHVSMLESGADQAETLPRLKEAALAAQQEARFAVLALSSAAGSAPFDAALRRYVDFLTADGELEVELEIDTGVHLAPDEQIEVFRIVQEGLSNTRRHAGARKASLSISQRGVDRLRLAPGRRRRLRRAGRRRVAGPAQHAPARRRDRRRLLAALGARARHRARSRAAPVRPCPGTVPRHGPNGQVATSVRVHG